MGEAPGANLFRFAGFTLDLGRSALLDAADQQLPLRPKSFDLLKCLVEHSGRVVTRDELLDAVWRGLHVSDESVTQCVTEVRRALHDGDQRLLRTVPKRGYVLMATVTQHPVLAAAQTSMTAEPSLTAAEVTNSLVVLPFTNLSGAPEQEYFADGMTEELTTALARLRRFSVAARGSAFSYRGRVVDVRQVGQELAARYVLMGSVRKAGNRVRIMCQLADAEAGREIWADRFEGDFSDIFKLQDSITEVVAGAVEPTILSAEIERARRKPTNNLTAYDLYLQALPHVYSMTQDGNSKALSLLQRALTVDPEFTLAKARASVCYVAWKTQGWLNPGGVEAGARLAREALAMANDDPHVLRLAGQAIANLTGSFDQALAAIDRAVAISPNSAQVLSSAGWTHHYACEPPSATALFRRAIQLSPRDPELMYTLSGLGLSRLMAGDAEEALILGRKAVALNSSLLPGRRLTVSALVLLDRLDEARSAAAELLAVAPSHRLSAFRSGLLYRNPSWADSHVAALRKAGLPD